MSLFFNNSFSLNNNLAISNKISCIPLFFLYYCPIIKTTNLDANYQIIFKTTINNNVNNSVNNKVQREIKYKIVELYYNNCELFIFNKDNFSRAMYHTFLSCFLLHKHNICFTMVENGLVCNTNSNSNDSLPILVNFSQSFYFPMVQSSYLKLYFRKELMENKYISIDVFLICYLLTNNIELMTEEICTDICELYCDSREKIEINKIKNIIMYFNNYSTKTIIEYVMQWKYTWSYYSLCYYFIINYEELISIFSLYDIFKSYIHCSFKERNIDLLKNIHEELFIQ